MDEFNGNITAMLNDVFVARKIHMLIHEIISDHTGQQDEKVIYAIVLLSSIYGALLRFNVTNFISYDSVLDNRLESAFLVFLARLTRLIACEDDTVCDRLKQIFEFYGISSLMLRAELRIDQQVHIYLQPSVDTYGRYSCLTHFFFT